MRSTRDIYIMLSCWLSLSLFFLLFQIPMVEASEEYNQASDVTDEKFFGEWDSDSSSWITESQINYGYNEYLKPIERDVKNGDYEAAKKHLLSYYQKRTNREELSFSKSEREKRPTSLLKDNIFTLGKGEHYIDTFNVNNDDSEVKLDVLDQVNNGKVAFFLMARNNEPSTAQFHSKEDNKEQPQLEVKVDGESKIFKPTSDFYIRAGPHQDEVLGENSVLEVRDEGPGAFAEETRKSYLMFDLSSLSGDPTEAILKITGKNITDDSKKKIMLFNIDNTDLKEEKQTWNNTDQDTYSWEGQSEGYDWKTPDGADTEYGYQIPRFYSAGPLAYEYEETGDESNAKSLINLMLDFIKDADSYDSPMDLGAGSYPRSLDTGERVVNWIKAYDILRSSKSMHPSENTDILKTIYKSGKYLKTQDTEGNWGVAENKALYHIATFFPELNKSSDWLKDANSTLKDHLQDSIHEDGSYIETSTSYATGVVNDYLEIKEFAALNNETFEGDKPLRKLGYYLMDVSLPNGDDPGFGDSSGLNVRNTLKNLGDVLDDPELTYVGTTGEKGKTPAHSSSLYPDDSTAIMKSGWSEKDLYSRLGVDDGGHNHPDENELIIYGYGKKLIPSTGTNNYDDEDGDNPISKWLRQSTESHNTVQIDDIDQDSSLPGSIDNLVKNNQFDFTEGVTESTSGFTHKRNVLFVKQGFWIVSDFINAPGGKHKYAQNWHFLPDANINIDSNTKNTQSHFEDGANIKVIPAEPDKLEASIKDGYYSPEFYKVDKAKYSSYVQNLKGNATFNTVLYPTEGKNDSEVSISPIETDFNSDALKIDRKNEDAIGFYYLSHENTPKEAGFADYRFNGKIAYIENDNKCKSISMHNGSILKKNDKDIIESSISIDSIGVENDEKTLNITGNDLEPNQNVNSSIAIYTPSVTNVQFNGKEVNFKREGDYIYAVGVKSSNKLKNKVNKFEKNGDINKQASHDLKMHLKAIKHYEDKGEIDKVIKHFKGFKSLLDQQKGTNIISNKIHEELMDDTNSLINSWEK